MIEQFPGGARLSRRNFLALAGLGAAATVTACSSGGTAPATTYVGPDSTAVKAAEQVRRTNIGTGNTVTASLKAGLTRIDLGGVQVDTWAYNDRIPGREIRLRRGDLLRAELSNELPAESTIHWHGVALRNDMDGVPGLTQSAIAPHSPFTYEFLAPDAGTHWLHPMSGCSSTGASTPRSSSKIPPRAPITTSRLSWSSTTGSTGWPAAARTSNSIPCAAAGCR